MPAPENHSPSLLQIEAEAWELLVNGSRNSKDGFYTGALGTQSVTGVSLRTVVLREARSAEKILVCYSDSRANKIHEIRQQPAVSFLFWDSAKKIQLRLSGKASVHVNNSLALQHWERTSLSNRRSYLAIAAPGSLQPQPASGLPEGFDTREPTQEESEKGRAHFAVIVTHIERMDWLLLDRDGHRRAYFVYEAGQLVSKSWIIP